MSKTTLAIVGSHPGTREQAPWDNPAVDILVFNEAANQNWVKRWNYVIQLHNSTIYRNPYNRTDPKHWEWLQRDHGSGKVIYMQERDALVPNSRKFPRDEIRKSLSNLTIATPDGLEHVEPVTNSISFALALGIYLGYRRLLVYGAEMASNTEYAYQRENFQFWLGVAIGRGVRVEMHSGQSMVDTPVYGYDGDLTYDPAGFDKATAENLKKLKVTRNQLKDVTQQLALADPRDDKELPKLMSQAFDAHVKLGMVAGSVCITRRYAIKARTMINQTGQALISRQEFEQGSAAALQEAQRIWDRITRIDGKLEEYYRSFKATGDIGAMKAFASLAKQQHQLGLRFGAHRGRSEANTALMLEADKRLKAAGGQRSFDAYHVQLTQPVGVAQ